MIKPKERKLIQAENSKRWRLKNPESYKASYLKFSQVNKDKINKKHKDRMANDMAYRERKLEYQRNWRLNNKEKQALSKKKSILKNTYGLSLDDYNNILKTQAGVCAICKKNRPYKNKGEFLCVDHNHKTGKTRGLLCHSCNRAIGMLGDDIIILKSAIIYLKKYGLQT